MTGTLNNRQGSLMRWKNDEQVPLQHVGNGKYVGVVDLVNDNSNPFCSFGIMACRSIEDMVNYSTTTRGSWTEARYGSETQYLEINSGEEVTDLVRGLDRTWRISPAGKYLIEFDMNNASMKATLLDTKGNGTEGNPLQIANKNDLQSLRDRMANGKTLFAKLTADIDMQGEGWWPLNSTFYANSYEEGYSKAISLDGTGHIIMNLTVPANKDNTYDTGFFGTLAGTVTNLGFYNANVDGGNAQNTGILAGFLGTDENPATVSDCYVHGKLVAAGAAGAIAGCAGTATVTNVYANANVSSEDLAGDLFGAGNETLTVVHSYGAGKFNDSQATAAFGDDFGASTDNVLYFGVQSQEEIADIVSQWQGWNPNGTIGNGWPLLQWQVERGDYAKYCGFGIAGDANGDGVADIADVTYVLTLMANNTFDARADINGDGIIDIADVTNILTIMANQ